MICYYTNEADAMSLPLAQFFRKLATALASEEHLIPKTADELRAQFRAGRSIIGVRDGALVAHTTLWPLYRGKEVGEWFELGSTWVHPAWRGRGVNEEMYGVFLPAHAYRNVLATTTNPASVSVGYRLGLEVITRRELPEEVWRASCVCPQEKTGSPTSDGCSRAYGESAEQASAQCFFRLSAATYRRLGLGGVGSDRGVG